MKVKFPKLNIYGIFKTAPKKEAIPTAKIISTPSQCEDCAEFSKDLEEISNSLKNIANFLESGINEKPKLEP